MEKNKNKISWDIAKYVLLKQRTQNAFLHGFEVFCSVLIDNILHFWPEKVLLHPTVTPTVNCYYHTVFLKEVGTQNTELKNCTPSCYFWAIKMDIGRVLEGFFQTSIWIFVYLLDPKIKVGFVWNENYIICTLYVTNNNVLYGFQSLCRWTPESSQHYKDTFLNLCKSLCWGDCWIEFLFHIFWSCFSATAARRFPFQSRSGFPKIWNICVRIVFLSGMGSANKAQIGCKKKAESISAIYHLK